MTSDMIPTEHALSRCGHFTKRLGNHHAEHHRSERIGWLRAAVLSANDGTESTASLVLGVAATGAEHRTIFMTSVSGLIANAMSMAAGEFVSVDSQEDTENADLDQEAGDLRRPGGCRTWQFNVWLRALSYRTIQCHWR